MTPSQSQPGQPPTQPSQQIIQVSNHLIYAIVATIFFFMPFGIIAIVYATQVNNKAQLGDLAGAQEASKKAKTWARAGVITGIVLGVAYLLLIILAGISESASTQ